MSSPRTTRLLVRGLLGGALACFAALCPVESASAEVVRDVTCKGCLLLTNAPAEEALPLVVVLHGDEGHPRKLAELWAGVAESGLCAGTLCTASATPDQRVRVFLPSCPRGEGCAGSYWRWGQSPAWFFARIDELSVNYAVAPGRIYFAGWSGGATYIGMFAEALSARAAGLSLVGGGAPSQEPCSAKACIRVDYLMGNANPLFDLAQSTRTRLEECGHDVRWQELPKADHAAEWRAYQREVPGIASRLLALSRAGCDAKPAAPTPPPEGTALRAVPTQSPERSTPMELPPTHGCACTVAGREQRTSVLAVVVMLVLGGLRRAKERGAGCA